MADVLTFPDRGTPPPKPLTPLRSVVEMAILHRCQILLYVSSACDGLSRETITRHGMKDGTVLLILDPSQSADRYASHSTDEHGMRLHLAFGGVESVVVVPWKELRSVMVREGSGRW